MESIETYNAPFLDYVELLAVANLTDEQYELEYQGLSIKDKCFYLSQKVMNIMPLYYLNIKQ